MDILLKQGLQALEVMSNVILKTNYGSETVIPFYITGCRDKIYFESAVVAKRRRLICAIYFLTTADDIKVSEP